MQLGILKVVFVRFICGTLTTGLLVLCSSRKLGTMTKLKAAGTPYMLWKCRLVEIDPNVLKVGHQFYYNVI